MSLSSAELTRYGRHLALSEVGVAGQEKLKAAKVLVIGAGGLGSPAILYLAAAGVGTIGIVDFDRVDVSNLQRQVLFNTASVGQQKTEVARQQVLALNPNVKVLAHQVMLRASNVREIFDGYDIVLDGTDRFGTRYLTNDACVILRKPLVSAAIHRFEGQAMTYVPDRGPCYRCLFPEPPAEGLVPNCAEAGVLGVLPAVLGAIQATEAIKLIVGLGEPLIGRLLTYDATDMRFGEFKFAPRDDCSVCSVKPTITELRDAPDLCSAETLQHVIHLSPRDLRARLGDPTHLLVDVREPHEYQGGFLPESINVPVGQLATRLNELPSNRMPVFICRSGTRSLTACAIASRTGLRSVAHLEGGLLAWAREVNTDFVVAMP